MKKYLLLLALLTPHLSLAFMQQESTKALHYKNQRGSLLTLVLHQQTHHSGTITGSFQTAVASSNCQDVIGKSHPVTGFYTGDSLALSMSYTSCGATVSVAGNFDKMRNIETLWIVANQGQDADGKNWNTRMIGHDFFKAYKNQG